MKIQNLPIRLLPGIILLFCFSLAKADVSRLLPINTQTCTFSVRYTEVPSNALIDGVIGLSGVPITDHSDFNFTVNKQISIKP